MSIHYSPINFAQKYALFQEQWAPKVVAEMNDYQFKIVRLEGDFVWHAHADTDETFIVLEGELRIDFRDGAVTIGAGEMYVVKKGVEHKPSAALEVKLRSEEHTSELQSLMRISYAVFCLKKKKTSITRQVHNTTHV